MAKLRTRFALLTGVVGFASGWLVARARQLTELETLREIVRENQHTNLRRMEQKRTQHHDETH